MSTTIDALVGRTVDVEHAYAVLTARGWKIDTEESNLMQGFSRTWRAHGIKVWVFLDAFVCAPPVGETGTVESVRWFRFDPAAMPTTTMAAQQPPPDDAADRARWLAEWQWLLDHGDPQFDTFDLLDELDDAGEVPAALVAEASADLRAAFAATDDVAADT